MVSFAIRFLVAATAFWLLDATGPRTSRRPGGLLQRPGVPLVLFPAGSRRSGAALPWAAYLQVPADIWLGSPPAGASGPGLQAVWAVVLLGACQLSSARARRVVVQGG